ncbi:hypothetical protein L6164_032536 [Bauhinia variegata]|uniref:Uncharacterized protein n=1 Tax=Bauhinia variegata TaxID=167791 RepID=A0ACB9KPC6_BAUVA|nr:hypothetical protein L6164_032536 [Bauhinia variegata]
MTTNICNAVIVMVLVQIAFGGVNVVYKLAMNDGMSLRVLVAYRFLFAIAFIAPVAVIFERKSRPKLTWTVLFQSFLSGLFGGALAQNFYLEAMTFTSATFASAMSNLTPAFTFIMAVCFRLEKFNVRTPAGMAKILGTLIGIGGAMVLTFFKGEEINFWSLHTNLLHHHQNGHVASSNASPSGSKTVLGFLFALGSCFSYAFWLIVQAKMSENYPCYYSSTALMCVNGAIVAIVYALCLEKDWNQWRLGWNIRLLTVAYSGVVASGIVVVVIAWCIHMRGPLFVSVFSPLLLVTVAIACSLLLDEKLHLGSIIGAVLIVLGLYVVLWGKGEEMKKMNQLVPTQSPNHSDTVEIVVDNKNNRNNSTQNEANIVVSDHDESSEKGK